MLKLVAVVLAVAVALWPAWRAVARGGRPATLTAPRYLLAGLALLVVLWPLGDSFGVVPAGYTGVKTLFYGRVLNDPVSEGLYMVPPGIEQVHLVDTRPHKLQLDRTEAVTSDRQIVHTTVALIVQIDAAQAPTVYRAYRSAETLDEQVVVPKFQEAVKTITARYSAPDQIRLRPQIRDEMVRFIQTELNGTGVLVRANSLAIVNFTYDPGYQDAIEKTQIAQQNLIKAENELRVEQINAQKAAARAKGEADAARLIAQANTATSLQKLFLDRWDGHLPQVMGGNNPGGLLFNIGAPLERGR